MLNQKIYPLLGMLLLGFTLQAFADNVTDQSNPPPDSTAVFALKNPNNLMECCYRQRVYKGWTQGTCPTGSYVIYAESRTRFMKKPAIWYKCEAVEVKCSYETPNNCAKQRANS